MEQIKKYNHSLRLSVFAVASSMNILPVLLNGIIDTYKVPEIRQGIMSSMASLGAFISLFIILFLQGRAKKTTILFSFGIITSASLLLAGINLNFFAFVVICLFLGLGYGGSDASQSAILADINKKDVFGHMGKMHAIFGLGGIVMPVVYKTLLDFFSWQKVFIITSVIAFALFIQFRIVFREKGNQKGYNVSDETLSLGLLREFFSNKEFILLCLCIFFGTAAQNGIAVWIVRYFFVRYDMYNLGTICLSVFWLATTLSRLISPKVPIKPVMLMSAGAFAAFLVWTVAVAVDIPAVLIVACGIMGLTTGSCIPLSLSVGTGMYPDKTGFSTSILIMFKVLSQVVSPIIIAFVIAKADISVGIFMVSVFFLLNGILALILASPKYFKKEV